MNIDVSGIDYRNVNPATEKVLAAQATKFATKIIAWQNIAEFPPGILIWPLLFPLALLGSKMQRNTHMVVASRGEQLVGATAARLVGGDAVVGLMAVARRSRGQGVGTEMANRLIDDLRASGATAAYGAPTQTSSEFYKKLGGEFVGVDRMKLSI